MNMRNTTSIDFRTPKERERDQRNKRICDKYVGLRASYPDMSINRIAALIGEAEGVSGACINSVLSKYQVI